MRALPQHCCTQASARARVRREARATQAPQAGARDTGAPGRRARHRRLGQAHPSASSSSFCSLRRTTLMVLTPARLAIAMSMRPGGTASNSATAQGGPCSCGCSCAQGGASASVSRDCAVMRVAFRKRTACGSHDPPGRALPGPHGAHGYLPAGRTEDRARRRLQHPLASRHRQGLEQPERGGRVDCARGGHAFENALRSRQRGVSLQPRMPAGPRRGCALRNCAASGSLTSSGTLSCRGGGARTAQPLLILPPASRATSMSSSSPSGQQGACSGAKATGGAVTKEGKSGQARGRPHQVSLRDDHVLLPGALAGASLPAARTA